MALLQNPVYQRRAQKLTSKASMRGQRPQLGPLMSEMADRELARKLQFAQLNLQDKRSLLMHKGQMAQLKMRRDALKDAKKSLLWQTGIGAGTALLSHLEGRRRAKAIADREARAEERFTGIMSNYVSQIPNAETRHPALWEEYLYQPARQDQRR